MNHIQLQSGAATTMKEITSNLSAAPVGGHSAPSMIGVELTAINALLAATRETAPPEMDRVRSVWQEDDSSFFMPERCTPLDDF